MPPFASHLNFLDQQFYDDGTPYSPIRYKEIVKECFIISKKIHTSYTDLMKITPVERNYLLEFLADDAKMENEMIKKAKAEREANKDR